MANTISHTQAAAIVQNALTKILGRTPTPTERALMQAVASVESMYGRAPGQHATWASQGLYTWGNIERQRNADGTCDEANGWYPGIDASNNRCFRLDKSDEEAAERYIKVMVALGDANSSDARTRAFAERSANIRAALSTGDPYKLASAMLQPASVAYYEASPDVYGKALTARMAQIDKEVPREVISTGKEQSPEDSDSGLPAGSLDGDSTNSSIDVREILGGDVIHKSPFSEDV